MSTANQKPKQPCFAHARGHCRFGERCKFSHGATTAGQSTPSAPSGGRDNKGRQQGNNHKVWNRNERPNHGNNPNHRAGPATINTQSQNVNTARALNTEPPPLVTYPLRNKGKGKETRPPPPAVVDDVPKSVTKTMRGSMSVVFQAGFEITSIVAIDAESLLSSMVVRNLTGPNTPARKQRIQQALWSLDDDVEDLTLLERGDETSVDAIFRFKSPEKMLQASNIINGKIFEDKLLLCSSLQFWISGRQLGEDNAENVTKIVCAWFRPSRTAFINFYTADAAMDAAVAKSYQIKGRTVKAKLMPNKRAPSLPGHVMLSGLPTDTQTHDIQVVFPGASRIDLKGPTGNFSTEDIEKRVKEEFGGDQAKIQFISKPDSDMQRVLIVYDNPAIAQQMFEKNRDKKQTFLGGKSLELELSYSIRIRIQRKIYDAVRKEVDALVVEYNGKLCTGRRSASSIRVLSRHTASPAIFIAHGNVKEAVAELRSAILKLINGEVICDENGQTLWDPALTSVQGKKIVGDATSNSRVYCYCDSRNQSITLYGSESARGEARESLRMVYALFYSKKQHVIDLPGGLFIAAYNRRLTKVRNLVGPANVEVDFLRKRLIVRCDEAELEKVERIVLPPEAGKTPQTKTVAAEDDCPVCLTEPEDSVQAPCGHHYCKPCIQSYFDSALTARRFPLACLHHSDTSCAIAFSIPFLRRVLPHATFSDLQIAAFDAHIQAHPESYSFCPTPDCATVYSRTTPTATCSSCFTTICTSCRSAAHPPHSCEEHQRILHPDRAYQEWRTTAGAALDLQPCPRCAIDIQKIDGCNHVTCVCGAHMCFACTPPKLFAEAAPVYVHMREEHPDGEAVQRQRETELERNERLLRELLAAEAAAEGIGYRPALAHIPAAPFPPEAVAQRTGYRPGPAHVPAVLFTPEAAAQRAAVRGTGYRPEPTHVPGTPYPPGYLRRAPAEPTPQWYHGRTHEARVPWTPPVPQMTWQERARRAELEQEYRERERQDRERQERNTRQDGSWCVLM